MTVETLRGELVSFRVAGQDFWGFGALRTRHDGGEVTITGKLVGCSPGDTLEVSGEFTVHARFGRQFKVRSTKVVLPSDVRGVIGWLASKLPQISVRRAELLVTHFGVDGLWQVLDKGDPEPLTVVDGLTVARATEVVLAYQAHREQRDQIVRLKTWGLTDAQVARVLEEWGDDAEEKLTSNPYQLIECVPGFGWNRADQVALRMGIRRDDSARVCAGLVYTLQQATQQGHCFSPVGKLVSMTATKTIGLPGDEALVRRELAQLVDRGKLVQREQHIFLPAIARAEAELATAFDGRSDPVEWRARTADMGPRFTGGDDDYDFDRGFEDD